jgi:Ala-tRNA(Pro) deacylase
MIPERIIRHLEEAGVPVRVRHHAREIDAQRLAAAVHVSGYRVVKSVLVEADGERMMAVLPAADIIDTTMLAGALDAERVRILHESEFLDLFPDCEVGGEPPFGSLYGLPVVMDGILARAGAPLILRAGSHDEALEMSAAELLRLERPRLGEFAVGAPSVPRIDEPEETHAWW